MKPRHLFTNVTGTFSINSLSIHFTLRTGLCKRNRKTIKDMTNLLPEIACTYNLPLVDEESAGFLTVLSLDTI